MTRSKKALVKETLRLAVDLAVPISGMVGSAYYLDLVHEILNEGSSEEKQEILYDTTPAQLYAPPIAMGTLSTLGAVFTCYLTYRKLFPKQPTTTLPTSTTTTPRQRKEKPNFYITPDQYGEASLEKTL